MSTPVRQPFSLFSFLFPSFSYGLRFVGTAQRGIGRPVCCSACDQDWMSVLFLFFLPPPPPPAKLDGPGVDERHCDRGFFPFFPFLFPPFFFLFSDLVSAVVTRALDRSLLRKKTFAFDRPE